MIQPGAPGVKAAYASVEPSVVHPEWKVYYVATVSAGEGFEFGPWTLNTAALGNMEDAIYGSIALYEAAMVDGLTTEESFAAFLTLARRWYSSCQDGPRPRATAWYPRGRGSEPILIY
jgi:hypothetical protein